ncbi:hypothetical protein L0Y49_03295 [bacterium]|nr:hypothetical protein [bacterium]
MRAKNEELKAGVSGLLEEFYKERETSEDLKLIIEGIGPAGHFRVAGTEDVLKKIRKDEMEKSGQELSREQEEIQAFGKFLKDKFFT